MRAASKFALAGCVVVLLSVCDAVAQTDGVRRLDTLDVVASAADAAREHSVPVQHFTAHELERLGVSNVGDAIKHFSGVTVKDYGGVGGMKTVSVRGMGAQHTAVFYDGVAVGDCQSGQVDLGRFSTENIDGLSLSIGADDDIYRSARMLSAAGVVSLQTQMPTENFLRTTLRAGSFDTWQASLGVGRLLGRGWRVSFFADYINSAGDYDFCIKNTNTRVEGRRVNSDVESVRGELSATWDRSDKHRLRAKLYAYSSERGVPGAVIVDNPLSSERLLGRNIFGQIFYEYIPNRYLRMKAAAKYNYAYDRNTLPQPVGPPDKNEYRQHETDFSYTLKWLPLFLEGVSFSCSEELFCNRLQTTNRHLLMAAHPRRVTALSAVNARYSGSRLCVTGSLLHTFAREYASDGYTAPRRSRWSPSLSLSVAPCRSLSLRASYKDIFRLPTFNDLYYRETGNYKLRPEKSRMLNVGATYMLAPQSFIGTVALSADAYCGRVDDKIVAVPGVFVWKMSNVDRVALSGVDANVAVEGRLPFGTYEFSSAYSYMHAVDDTDGSLVKGDQIAYTPRHSGSVSAALFTKIINAGYSLVWSGKRYRLPQNIASNEIAAYCDHSLWLSCAWRLGHGEFTARFDAMNLADNNYEIVRYYPMPGRNYRLSIIYKI